MSLSVLSWMLPAKVTRLNPHAITCERRSSYFLKPLTQRKSRDVVIPNFS